MLNISFNFRLLCLIAVALALAGCADSPAKLGTRAYENKKKMVDLKPDMTTEQVRNLMGSPDKMVMQRGKNNEAVLIYLYITQYVDTYSRGYDKNNYTPVIFVHDRLSGWGWNYLDRAAERYELDLRATPLLAPSQ